MKLFKSFSAILAISILYSCNFNSLIDNFTQVALAQDKPLQIYTYNVKGVIVSLPTPDKPSSKLKIRHEPISEYVDETGTKVGMNAMTMPFELKDGLNISDLQVGDNVEFTLESWWKPKPGDQITEIRKLGDF